MALSEQKYFSKFLLLLLLETHLTLLMCLYSGHERSKQSANTGNAFSSEIEFLCVGVDGRKGWGDEWSDGGKARAAYTAKDVLHVQKAVNTEAEFIFLPETSALCQSSPWGRALVPAAQRAVTRKKSKPVKALTCSSSSLAFDDWLTGEMTLWARNPPNQFPPSLSQEFHPFVLCQIVHKKKTFFLLLMVCTAKTETCD